MSTFNENRRAGVIPTPHGRPPVADAPQAVAATDHPASADARQTDPPPATDRATRTVDKHAPMGRAARDVEGRMRRQRRPDDRGRAGVRRARPRRRSRRRARGTADAAACGSARCRQPPVPPAPDGFYGLARILLFVAFMTWPESQPREPAATRRQASGVRSSASTAAPRPTLRRKIRLLTSAEHTVRDWQSALARPGPPSRRRLGHAGRGWPG